MFVEEEYQEGDASKVNRKRRRTRRVSGDAGMFMEREMLMMGCCRT